MLCFHGFTILFTLLLAHNFVNSITIFIIGYIINTSLTTGFISFILNLLIFVVTPSFHLLLVFYILFFVLAPSSKLHITTVELDL